jgi:hypothetical protein
MRKSVSKRLIRQAATNIEDKIIYYLGFILFLVFMALSIVFVDFFYVGFGLSLLLGFLSIVTLSKLM